MATDLNCTGCGACCRHMRSPPHMAYWKDGVPFSMGESGRWDEDLEWLLAAPEIARKMFWDGIEDDRPDESPCSWLNLETMQCRFYEFRPGICRDFDLGGESCLATRKVYGITA